MVLPRVDSRTHLVHVPKPIVDRGDAGDGARSVVQEALDDVRRDTERREISCERPAKIVKRPRRNRSPQPPVKSGLGLAPSMKWLMRFSTRWEV